MRLVEGWRRLMGYFAHPDPRLALGGTVALIVVGNQPFYPFYVWYVVGRLIPAAFLTFLSTPLFAAAPAIVRRSPGTGLAVLIGAALGNTALCARALGPATGVELFYLPSLLLAVVTRPPGRRLRAAVMTTIGIGAGLAIARLTGPPWALLSPGEAHGLVLMHATSVVCLLAVMTIQAWRAGRPAAQPKRLMT